MSGRPEVLIERWLPVDTLSAECLRERGSSSALPPLYFLHVWWARRPLTVSRAAILASVLPAWREDWPKSLRQKFPTEEAYQNWFVELCGIFGDPVAGRKALQAAQLAGKVIPNPYKHQRAYTVSPSRDYVETLGACLGHTWGTDDLTVLDPFAGGGSIPFEALRYHFGTVANELNAVAAVILKTTVDYPFRFGAALADQIEAYGGKIVREVQRRLQPFFSPPLHPEATEAVGVAYLWARTVTCPYTGKPIPLSPNWWLRKEDGEKATAVRPIFDPAFGEARFEIVTGARAVAAANPSLGTVRNGKALSPWANHQPVDGDYIKAEAQAGRLGQQLYCVAVKKKGGFDFRLPTPADLEAVARAEKELARRLPLWQAKGWVPDEAIPEGLKTVEPHRYGFRVWSDLFSPRQLLSLLTFLEVFHEVRRQVEEELEPGRAKAVLTYLAFVLDKAADYNSRMVPWHPARMVLAHTFDRHDFSFKWSHGEWDAARNLFPWALEQVLDAYEGMARLASPPEGMFEEGPGARPARVVQGNAADLSWLADGSIHHICVDPPYYDNVMYSELSDFFYVWLKRTVGDVYPELFRAELTNKDDEAVANPARFGHLAKKKKELARADYERKMLAAFREMRRVLRDDGVLTVMFTHKQVEAWDSLATSLISAGFAIKASWPVHTESEHSLHQAKKNAAQSTILLACRKRTAKGEPAWWDDIKGKVRLAARENARRFEAFGLRGVDLYLATFGPTLAILSEHWPVLTSQVDPRTGDPLPLRPDVALDLAREEVIALRKEGLLLGRTVTFDPVTDWYVMAWDAFRAQEFPADEARKLALALGLDLERQLIAEKRLISKKEARVVLQLPQARRRKLTLDADVQPVDCWIDAMHAAMVLYEEDGAAACEAFLQRTGLRNDVSFRSLVQALLQAIPRTRKKGEMLRPEARVLEAMRLAFFDDLEPPKEEEDQPRYGQMDAFARGEELGGEEAEEQQDLDEEYEGEEEE